MAPGLRARGVHMAEIRVVMEGTAYRDTVDEGDSLVVAIPGDYWTDAARLAVAVHTDGSATVTQSISSLEDVLDGDALWSAVDPLAMKITAIKCAANSGSAVLEVIL